SISGSDISYPNPVNITPSESNMGDSDVTYTWFRSGTGLINTTIGSSPSVDISQLGARSYTYTLNTTSATFANWTANSTGTSLSITVSKGILNLSVSGSNVTWPNAVNVVPAAINLGDNDINYIFYRNSTILSSVIGSSPASDTSKLTPSLYTYTLNTTSATFANST